MKRFLALLCMVACTVSLVGCNGGTSGIFNQNSDGMILTINGKDYDLTGHFNENVAEMVKDDLVVVFPHINPPRTYEENGYGFSDVSFRNLTDEEKSNTLFATQTEHMRIGPATLTYYINNLYDTALEFETINGITQDFDAKDIRKLEGFVPTVVGYTQRAGWDPENGEYACAALYVDGKLMDISSYEEEAEAMLEDPTLLQDFSFKKEGEETLSADTPEFFTHKLFSMRPLDGSSSGIAPKDNPLYEQYKNTLMLLLAERDVYWDIQDGKAEYMCLISYTYLEEEFAVAYELYGTDYTPRNEWKDHAK